MESRSGDAQDGDDTSEEKILSENIKRRDIQLPDLPIEDWPQSIPGRCYIDKDEINGYPDLGRSDYDGDEGYHPLVTARNLLEFSTCMRKKDSKAYNQKARNITERLLRTAVSRDEAIYFPYTFDFPLHGYEEHTMSSPWFSGMAQGVALSAFSRLATITGGNLYREVADLVFTSFTNLRGTNQVVDPWTVTTDENRHYWIEEYPEDPPAHTLNGKIFAIWGLYEYYQLTDLEEAKYICEAAITTVAENIGRFRVPNEMSYYCLSHDVQDAGYHMTHINQLKKLHELTGIEEFSEYESAFRSDYSE